MVIKVPYLSNLLKDMDFLQTPNIPVYEDNTVRIKWGNHVIGGREHAKHIDIHKHFAHEVIQNHKICLYKVDASDLLADIFNKAVHCISPGHPGNHYIKSTSDRAWRF